LAGAPGRELAVTGSGLRLHVVKAGPPDGPLVILLHGFPELWYGWRHQMPALAAAGWRVMAPDQRGYGHSDKPDRPEDYALDRLGEDIVGLADAAGRTSFCVVGHDWGGIVAWWLAQQHPERVARAVILNAPHPAAFRRYALLHPGQLARSWYVLFFQLPALPELAFRAGGYRLGVRALKSHSRPGTFSAEDIARYRSAWEQPGALTGMINWYRALRLGLPESGRVRNPVLVLWGDRDAFLQPGVAEDALRLADDARLVHLPEAGHWLHHEEPDRVNQLLLAFLADTALPVP
jgi:pimeloyl-ACP methyl ester carboxylesterase